jgi:hypothetical protein
MCSKTHHLDGDLFAFPTARQDANGFPLAPDLL